MPSVTKTQWLFLARYLSSSLLFWDLSRIAVVPIYTCSSTNLYSNRDCSSCNFIRHSWKYSCRFCSSFLQFCNIFMQIFSCCCHLLGKFVSASCFFDFSLFAFRAFWAASESGIISLHLLFCFFWHIIPNCEEYLVPSECLLFRPSYPLKTKLFCTTLVSKKFCYILEQWHKNLAWSLTLLLFQLKMVSLN